MCVINPYYTSRNVYRGTVQTGHGSNNMLTDFVSRLFGYLFSYFIMLVNMFKLFYTWMCSKVKTVCYYSLLLSGLLLQFCLAKREVVGKAVTCVTSYIVCLKNQITYLRYTNWGFRQGNMCWNCFRFSNIFFSLTHVVYGGYIKRNENVAMPYWACGSKNWS